MKVAVIKCVLNWLKPFLILFLIANQSYGFGSVESKYRCGRFYDRQFVLDFKKLPSAYNISIPEKTKQIVGEFRDKIETLKLGDGDNMVVSIDSLNTSVFSIGRHIAAQYIAELVKLLFPKVTFAKKHYALSETNYWGRHESLASFRNAYPQKKIVEIALSDTTGGLFEPSVLDVPMSKVKLANPGIGQYAHKSFRRLLGIPKKETVFSIYLKEPETEGRKTPSKTMVIQEILRASLEIAQKPPDIFFLSEAGGNALSFKKPEDGTLDAYEVIKISEWSTRFRPGKKYIVLNDIEGVMPSILNVSDAAYVSGPNNIVEPISAGAKVFFLNNPEVLRRYNQDNFNRMAELVKATGGGFELKSIDDFIEKYRESLQSSAEIVPTYMQKPVIEDLLNSILEVIQDNERHQAEIIEKIRELNAEKNGSSYYHGGSPYD